MTRIDQRFRQLGHLGFSAAKEAHPFGIGSAFATRKPYRNQLREL